MNVIVVEPFPEVVVPGTARPVSPSSRRAVAECEAFEAAIRVLGRRWAGAVVRAMLDGAARFGEIRAGIPGITDAMLTARLRELCGLGLVERRVVPETPVLVTYRLTRAGRDLEQVLTAIEAYGRKHRALLRRGSRA